MKSSNVSPPSPNYTHMLPTLHSPMASLASGCFYLGQHQTSKTAYNPWKTEFIPALTGKPVLDHHERELFALPVRLGGLGLINATKQSDLEYTASINISCPLLDLIMSDESAYVLPRGYGQAVPGHKGGKEAKTPIPIHICLHFLNHASLTISNVPSSWHKGSLKLVVCSTNGFALHKGEFHDALALRYGWLPQHVLTNCACGNSFSVEHALSCPKGGYPTIRHNEIRDLTATAVPWDIDSYSEIPTDIGTVN